MDHPRPTLEERFAELVAEHQGWLRAFIRSLGIRADAVDDVAQEVFLVAYRRYSDYDQALPFAAWLKGIARNLAANERRRQQHRGRLIEPSLAAALEAVDEAADQGSEEAEGTVAALRLCLDQLPGHSRELLRLRYEEDLDAAGLGERLGREGNAVRQALFRVREMVRRCVEGRLAGVTP